MCVLQVFTYSLKRKGRSHGGACVCGAYLQIAAKVPYSFRHTSKTDTASTAANHAEFVRRDASTRVFGRNKNSLAILQYADRGGLAPGMAMDICKALLNDPENSGFFLGRKATEIG
jgi:hypothetical protein